MVTANWTSMQVSFQSDGRFGYTRFPCSLHPLCQFRRHCGRSDFCLPLYCLKYLTCGYSIDSKILSTGGANPSPVTWDMRESISPVDKEEVFLVLALHTRRRRLGQVLFSHAFLSCNDASMKFTLCPFKGKGTAWAWGCLVV